MKVITIDGKEYNLIPVERMEGEENQKDWKILEFRNYNSSFRDGYVSTRLRDNGKYVNSTDPKAIGYYTLEQTLSYPHWKIYSVEYKGTVFSIGDNVIRYEGKEEWIKGIITSFYTSDDNKRFGVRINNGPGFLMTGDRGLKKMEEKPVLFTTEDGILIREGDWFFYTAADFQGVPLSRYADKDFLPHVTFSTIEKCKEYIDLNKKVYSKQEVLNAIEASMSGVSSFTITTFKLKQNLKL